MKRNNLILGYKKMIEHYNEFEFKDCEEPSNEWLDSFLERNQLKKKNGQVMEKERVDNSTTATINHWFKNVYLPLKPEQFDERLVFNGDECMLYTKNKRVVVCRKNSKKAFIQECESQEHITLMTCMSVAGDVLTPFFIVPLENCPTSLDKLIEDGHMVLGGQKSGWMDKSLFEIWIEKFINFVNEKRKIYQINEKPAILFVDSHSSRESSLVAEQLKKNNIILITYPPKMTHILQALDVGIFSHFKRYFNILIGKYLKIGIKSEQEKELSEIGKKRLILIFTAIDALKQAFTLFNIRTAFKISGTFPPSIDEASKNPYVRNSDENWFEFNVTNKKRNRLEISGKIVNSTDMIESLKNYEKEVAAKKEEKEKKKVINLNFN